MKRYKTRPGVILTEIVDEYFLVAAKALLEECPYVMQINESSAFLWKHMENGANLDELEKAVKDEYEIDDLISARDLIVSFISHMEDMHYISIMNDD